MDTYRTEEEQVEALRKWWNENGRSTIIAVVHPLGGGFGWQAWQQHKADEAAMASARYEQMVELFTATTTAEDAANLKSVARGFKSDFPDSTYASFAALHLARLAVVEDDLAGAETELRWVLTQNPEREVRLVTELRLARVIAAQGRLDEALGIVGGVEAGAYEPAYAELEGDIQQQLGNTGAAIAAYQRAMTLAAGSNEGPSEGLRLKLQALMPVPARKLAVLEE